MKINLFALSIIFNVVLLGMLCFILYYKRDSIIRYANRFYSIVINKVKPSENSLPEFNQNPVQINIQYKNIDLFEKRIKLAIVGNSISLSGIYEGLWEYESGMAASDLEHDYIHVLVEEISEQKQCAIEYIVINNGIFERTYDDFNLSRLEGVREFSPDIIIFQLGENVSTEMLIKKCRVFVQNYLSLIEYSNSKETIVCLPFWPNKEIIYAITEVAYKSGSYLVDLSHLGSGIDPLNFASAERKYKHGGAGGHPGDYGMKNIAKLLYITINKIIK
jgi:hypothetical protein